MGPSVRSRQEDAGAPPSSFFLSAVEEMSLPLLKQNVPAPLLCAVSEVRASERETCSTTNQKLVAVAQKHAAEGPLGRLNLYDCICLLGLRRKSGSGMNMAFKSCHGLLCQLRSFRTVRLVLFHRSLLKTQIVSQFDMCSGLCNSSASFTWEATMPGPHAALEHAW